MAPPPDAAPGIRVGVSPLSWINGVLEDLGRDTPIEQVLDEAAAAGYAGVEFGRKMPTDAAALGALLRPRGLALASGWHSGNLAAGTVADEMRAVANHAGLLAAMGSTVMVYGECGHMAQPDPLDRPLADRLPLATLDLPAYAARLVDFARQLRATHGLALAYHPHLMMVAEQPAEVDALFAAAGDEVGLLLDTGHCEAGGGVAGELAARWGQRALHVHLKDVRHDVMAAVRAAGASFNDGVRRGMFTVPGDGDVDFTPVAARLRATGYTGWLVVEAEQDPAVAPPVPAVTQAREFVRATFGH